MVTKYRSYFNQILVTVFLSGNYELLGRFTGNIYFVELIENAYYIIR